LPDASSNPGWFPNVSEKKGNTPRRGCTGANPTPVQSAHPKKRQIKEKEIEAFVRAGVVLPSESADEKGKFDELVEEKGVKVLIDPKALMHVIGTKMDYVDDPLKSEFVFINPNSKGECGCGESFMTTSSKGSTS
ncbi:unnamed protein product, partial [Urochloa humidicola]